MVKRRDLIRRLEAAGCRLVRQGRSHEIWASPSGRRSTVPRHREIPAATARAICRQLDVSPPLF
jgi:predicted RNA binding protein YcfA (HicA-like mRNA interferase family)